MNRQIDSGRLIVAIYGQLHRWAQHRMWSENAEHTLQPTALVHEAYIRLAKERDQWDSRAQFYTAAATAMRRILVEHARARARIKRAPPGERLAWDQIELEAPGSDPELLLGLDEALDALEKLDRRMFEVAQLRCIAGLRPRETAALLGISERTERREWEAAKLYLYRKLSGADEVPGEDRTGESREADSDAAE